MVVKFEKNPRRERIRARLHSYVMENKGEMNFTKESFTQNQLYGKFFTGTPYAVAIIKLLEKIIDEEVEKANGKVKTSH